MNVLFVSNLYPNRLEPTRGVHNAQQAAALAKLCTVRVIAPTHRVLLDEPGVCRPRFRHVPLLSRRWNGWLFARAIEPVVRRERFDVVLVNWAYPDAYGVMLVAQAHNFPFVTTVQGSDVNVLFANQTRRRQVLSALRASRAVLCRSEALRATLADHGIDGITVYNGIDQDTFRPLGRAASCHGLGLDPSHRRVLFVGNLLPVKGPAVLAAAAPLGVDTVFVGTGTERTGAGRRVGARPHREIPLWMNASDVLCLPSLHEGLPNVVLEALACGIPVVASRVGGVPEIVRDGINGLLVPPNDPGALRQALHHALSVRWDRDALRDSVKRFDWNLNARTVHSVLEGCLA
jgi:glycosyltransferase involved in cell wall biosynthesis